MYSRLGGVSVGFGRVKLTVVFCIALLDLGVQPSFVAWPMKLFHLRGT